MNVLITGGCGCIGAWVCRRLVAAGHSPVVFDRQIDTKRLGQVEDSPGLLTGNVRFAEGDITEVDQLAAAVTAHGVTHVIHLAALQVPTCRADPLLGARVNVMGTLAVFEAARRCGVGRLVYASSAAVFGPAAGGPLADDAAKTPATHYGAFKVCNEMNARVYFAEHGVSSIGLRPWTVYGVGRDQGMTSEPTKAIKAVALGRPYHISYGGSQDLQLADDVAGAFVRCLEVPFDGAKSYNLRGEVIDLPGFVAALAAADPTAAELVTHGDAQLAIAYDLDDAGLRADISLPPPTPLAEGVTRTLGHFRRLNGEGRLDVSDLS